MNILLDENFAMASHFFADHAHLQFCAGRSITNQQLRNVDALLVRSVTKVDAELIKNTPVKFVGSATIGTDHLAIDQLQSKGIAVANAPGCNAQAVAEYVTAAIAKLRADSLTGEQITLGIVGYGQVGQRLAALASKLGWSVLICDPYNQQQTWPQMTLNQMLSQVDVLSLHVPMQKISQFPTYHLIAAAELEQLKAEAMIINTSRGAVIDNQALLHDIKKNKRQVVLDVFEQEPTVPMALVSELALTTPHIAGYSQEGKARGSWMVYQAFCQHFAIKQDKPYLDQLGQCPVLFSQEATLAENLSRHLDQIYPIQNDDAAFRLAINGQQTMKATDFDALRKNYPLRREWHAYGFEGE